MDIYCYLILLFNLFKNAFSFLIRINFYYSVAKTVTLEGYLYTQYLSASTTYFIYNKQPGDTITIKFGNYCVSSSFRFAGYINFDGSVYTTSKQTFFVNQNSIFLYFVYN